MADLWEQAAQEYKASGAPGAAQTKTSSSPDDWKLWNAGTEVAPEKVLNPWQANSHMLTDGFIGQGVQQIGRGFKKLTAIQGVDAPNPGQPDRPTRWQGGTDILTGVGKVAAPFAIGAALPAAIGAPLATAGGLVAGTAVGVVGDVAGRYGSQAMGASPEAQEFFGTAGGTVGGLAGGYAGSKLPNLFRVKPNVAVNRSLRPTPSSEGFDERLPDTLAAIKAANPPAPPTTFGGKFKAALNDNNVFSKPAAYIPQIKDGKLDLMDAANKAISAHQDAGLEPWFARMDGTRISGEPMIQATREALAGMPPSAQGNAQAILDQARMDYGRGFDPRGLKAHLEYLNKESDPFFRKSAAGQSSSLANTPDAVLKAQRDASANTLYNHLDPENAGAGPRQIQATTGDLIDVRNGAARRNNAIVAEQPLTPIGKLVDPIKGMIRHFLPVPSGAGIAYAEGSEGRSLPYLQRAFAGADETAGANAFGNLPRPGPRLLNAPADTSGSVPPGVSDAKAVGSEYTPGVYGPKLLTAGTTPIGVSGKVMPEWSRARPQTLLPPPVAGRSPLNVLGPENVNPPGNVTRVAPSTLSETSGDLSGPKSPALPPTPGMRMPGQRGGRMADLVQPQTPTKVNMADITSYADRKGLTFIEATRQLQSMGFQIDSGLPPRIQ